MLRGGLSDSERIAVAQLHLSYSLLAVNVAAATRGKVKPPKLEVYIPPVPDPEPVRPTTFMGWARTLLPLAGRTA